MTETAPELRNQAHRLTEWSETLRGNYQTRTGRAGGAFAAAFCIFAGATQADPVQLRSTDGTVNFEGELISFNEGNYLLQTVLGDIQISSELVNCHGAGCPVLETVEADITVAGADTIARGMLPLLLEGFATTTGAESQVASAQGDDIFATTLVGQQGFGERMGTFEVRSGDSEDAFDSLLEKTAHLGVSTRRILPEEARALAADGAGNMIDPSQEHIIAVDSLNVIVNPANPVTAISMADLAGIYSGRITNWRELGGEDLAILPVTLEDEAETEVFVSGIFGDDNRPTLFSSFTADDNVTAANYVGENPGALAYVGFAFKRGQRAVSLISECGIGTTPDAFSVKTEEYTLFRRLFMYNRADMDTELAAQFVDFATSDAASIVINQSGFIDLAVERQPQGPDSPRARRIRGSGADRFENNIVETMISDMEGSDRLSSTFRFRTGSAELDPRGLRDIDRLAAYLADQPAGTEVSFVGFADSVGAFEPNITLSRARADQVLAALKAKAGNRLDHISFTTTGYGEIAPSACNTNDAGRSINRRVETWVSLP